MASKNNKISIGVNSPAGVPGYISRNITAGEIKAMGPAKIRSIYGSVPSVYSMKQ